jgi:tRNA (uracil-5-)-methyltransferase TRM9
MKQATAELLHALNLRFYTQHAEEFSDTRRAPWPGLARALEALPAAGARVLDVGCGNGRALPALRRHHGDGLDYLGIDASEPLLAIARARWAGPGVRFVAADFAAAPPERALPDERFALVLLLGVLHCIASEPGRRALLAAAAQRLAPDGALVLTIWRYDRDPRFAERRVPAAQYPALAPQLAAEQLDPGDELLRFGSDPGAVRYAHFPDEAELQRLLRDLPLREQRRFRADGAGQQLNDYLVLRSPAPA